MAIIARVHSPLSAREDNLVIDLAAFLDELVTDMDLARAPGGQSGSASASTSDAASAGSPMR